MFARRRRATGGRGGLGLLLLAMQLYGFLSRNNRFFPVMLGVLALNVIVYLRPDALHWPSATNACISASKVWLGKRWQPLLYSAFTHANDFHLYYNMASFIWKAATLEQHFGSIYFLYMTSVFTALTGVLYVGIEVLLAHFLSDWSYMTTCAVGFSGVVFALKVVTTHLLPPGNSYVMGIPIPSRLACWAELVLISVITPNASFVGHLAGILVGLAFVSGPLKAVMDIPVQMLESHSPRNVTGDRGGRRGGSRYTYAARTTGYRDGRNSEEEELQQAILQSQNEYQQQTQAHRRDQFRSQHQRHEHHHQQQDLHHQDPRSSTDEADLQEAIERSIQDSRPPPPTEPPPPINPYYSISEGGSAADSSDSTSTLPGASSSSLPYPDDDSVSGMPVPGGRTREHSYHQPAPAVASDNRTAMRAARLRRFNKTS